MAASEIKKTDDERRRLNRRRIRVVLLAIFTTILFAMLFIQAAFNTLPWFRPSSASETLSLYVLSTINFLAFIVLLMVLVRNVLKLRRERQERKLGSKFKTRLVAYFILLALLPVMFLFFATTGLINRSIDKWFSLPGDQMLSNALAIQSNYIKGEKDGFLREASTYSRILSDSDPAKYEVRMQEIFDEQQLLAAELYASGGAAVFRRRSPEFNGAPDNLSSSLEEARNRALNGETYKIDLAGNNQSDIFVVVSTPFLTDKKSGRGGALVLVKDLPDTLAVSVNNIKAMEPYYESLKGRRKWYKSTSLQTLALITLLVLFIAFWLALYIARSIADPVRQMAEATEQIKKGDLSYRADVVGDDELEALAKSFNEMMSEMSDNRRKLEQTNTSLDERRRYIETVLQSLSAGVISLDEHATVTMINHAALDLLKIEQAPEKGVALVALLPEEQREELRKMILRASRVSSVSREVHFMLSNHAKLDAAVTVTSLQDPHGQSRGTVIVLEDLSELIEAQRRAAWSEVARRMAHEIKNPLTPIRLSAERLAKNLIGDGNGARDCLNERQTSLISECTSMIGAEVATLQRMVDEFSNFARLPNARLELASINEVVENTLKLYDERLNGVRIESSLLAQSPVLIDPEQIKRVIVNLIDNAAEALYDLDGERCISVSTREIPQRDVVELTISDTGLGIAKEDRERIFGPYFSTRKRGTGLGLAIVSRIVAEHQGRIRVQENFPRGARFIIELPVSS